MKRSHLWEAMSACVLILVPSATNASILSLEGRLPVTPGGADYQAYYDPNLDITWAADANINGLDTWDNQTAWAAGLTIGGVSGWRLPSADVNGDGAVVQCNGGGVAGCEDNEMGYLYWEEAITVSSPGPFSGIQSAFYWQGTLFGTDGLVGAFLYSNGAQGVGVRREDEFSYAWAVHSGDIGSAVPTPAALWLFGSGILGLIGISQRK